MTLFALTVYVPLSHEHAVRYAIACSKGGAIGNYDSCSFTTIGVGRFRPLEGANPHLGCIGSVEEVEEAKIETTVLQENLSSVIQAVKSAHPYEEPAIHIVQVIDYKEIISNNKTEPSIRPISVVLEGLDGVGKSTVAVKLAEIMNARHMCTPPTIMHSAREWFVQQDNHMRKAYYMVGNFIAGSEMQQQIAENHRNVVLDRYYASTMAYIIGKRDPHSPLPARDDPQFSWPTELYKPTCMFVLVLPEEDRVARRQSRTTVAETVEEKLLRNNPAIPVRINNCYEALGCTRIELLGSDDVDMVVNKVLLAIKKETGLSF